jgi:colicin import membrane protein
MTAATLRLPPGPRTADNLSGSFALALLMHGLLFGAMTLAVQWRTQPAAPIVAELWSALPAQPEPVPQAAPPPPPPPPPKQEAEPEKPADIVVKQEKKPEPKKEEKKPEPRKDYKKAEPRKAEEKPRPQTDLERIMAQAGTAAPAAAGAPAGASGVRGSDSGYSARVIGCIRPHIVFVVPEGTGANVYAEFRIELLPDASVAGVRLTRTSGLPGYDAAAERAIRRCDPFPRKSDGTLDRTIELRMYPVEPR